MADYDANPQGGHAGLEFVVVDVETANSRHVSICQIGIACFRAGTIVESWTELVDPEDSFLPFNTLLHGIGPADVAHCSIWPELQDRIRILMERRIVASHTYFDRVALNNANLRYGLPPISVRGWVDTCRMARLAWPHLPNHKLPTLARRFGISYRAHDAMDDARCAGEVLSLAAQSSSAVLETLLTISQVACRVKR